MMHLFMRKGPWFRAKSHGFGTGLPIVWEGWFFIALHVAMITGLAAGVAGSTGGDDDRGDRRGAGADADLSRQDRGRLALAVNGGILPVAQPWGGGSPQG